MRTRWIITLVTVAVLGIAGIAVAARGGEGESKKTTGTDLTALMCPMAPSGGSDTTPSKPAKNAFNTAELIGLSLAGAKAKAAQHSCTIVVSLEDGAGKPVPIDVDPRRIYVYTEKGRVTEIEDVGGGV
ncbi:hypothetical protein [Candidatus Solirubrobacter pratensis]|uniref:hypothetical protein n=1 Tax=Candidatus Solirubrobacter pratensis TaxID=1298857 RepID=UPI0004091B22|nr:hypothetical protein [Candidatus Solirubrobacter pratensis]